MHDLECMKPQQYVPFLFPFLLPSPAPESERPNLALDRHNPKSYNIFNGVLTGPVVPSAERSMLQPIT